MKIYFSEKLKSLDELMQGTKRSLKEDFLEITYVSHQEGNCTPLRPALVDWYISKFTNYQLEVFLNFTNPLFVSSSEVQDEISVRVKNPYVFQSHLTNVTAKMNYTTTLYLPSMTSSEDSDTIMSLGEQTKNSMIFTLIIPFGFMVFMSFSMDRVWSMYNML